MAVQAQPQVSTLPSPALPNHPPASAPAHLHTPGNGTVGRTQDAQHRALHLDLHSLQGPIWARIGDTHLWAGVSHAQDLAQGWKEGQVSRVPAPHCQGGGQREVGDMPGSGHIPSTSHSPLSRERWSGIHAPEDKQKGKETKRLEGHEIRG